jgi:hypothetical protein
MRGVEVLKQESGFHYIYYFKNKKNMHLKIAFRLAVPSDLKQDQQNLKIGQPYAITKDEGDTIAEVYIIKGDEDPFILKHYLENHWIFVPVNSPSFKDWIKEIE